MKHLSESALVHEIVDREVLHQSDKLTQREPRFPSLLSTLASESEDIVATALGETGSRLRAFAHAIRDSRHPDLYYFKGGVLADDEEFAVVASEMVKLTSLATGAKLSTILPHISKIVPKVSNYFPQVKDLDDPQKTLNHVRFVADKGAREAIRRKKKPQTVNIQTILQKSPEVWDPTASSFASLPRNQTPFKQDIDVANRRAVALASLGASGLASRMQQRATEFKLHKNEQYYGFNRLTVTSASIIAGKLMECDLTSASMRNHRVCLPVTTHEAIFEKVGEPCPARNGAVLYEPRLYPLHTVEHVCPSRTRSLIDLLDCFPEAGGCPIFDHFWCLVPSIFVLNIPTSYGSWSNNMDDLARNFDFALLKHAAVPAVLLADKDGKSFFIDYWC